MAGFSAAGFGKDPRAGKAGDSLRGLRLDPNLSGTGIKTRKAACKRPFVVL